MMVDVEEHTQCKDLVDWIQQWRHGDEKCYTLKGMIKEAS